MDGLAVWEWGDPTEPGVLLWPGLGATSAYFRSVAPALPGRAVVVDPPGFGRSAPPPAYSHQRLVDAAARVIEVCGCRAIVGHSLGAYVAAGVAGEPPAGLRAAVLIDGGFLDAKGMAGPGHARDRRSGAADRLAGGEHAPLPGLGDRDPRVGDDVRQHAHAGTRGLSPRALHEADGEIRDLTPPDRMADLIHAVFDQDVPALAARVAVPALLIACGVPAERRPMREQAWRAFASASPLVELHVAEDWGHNPILQDPEGSAHLIANWLQRHLR